MINNYYIYIQSEVETTMKKMSMPNPLIIEELKNIKQSKNFDKIYKDTLVYYIFKI